MFPSQVASCMPLFVVALCLCNSSSSTAQGISVASPASSVFDSFYSRTGIGFALRLPGSSSGGGVVGLTPQGNFTPDGSLFFQQGNASGALPPFGAYDPNADARFGFRVGGNSGPSFSLGLVAGQGSSRSIASVTPSLTIPSGGSGYLWDGRWSPFVTGWVPIVGTRAHYLTPMAPPTYVHPLHIKLNQLRQQVGSVSPSEDELEFSTETDDEPTASSAGPARDDSSSASRPAASVAELRRQRAAQVATENREQTAQVDALVAAAEAALAKGFPGSARTKLRQALRLADASQKESIQRRLDQLEQTP